MRRSFPAWRASKARAGEEDRRRPPALMAVTGPVPISDSAPVLAAGARCLSLFDADLPNRARHLSMDSRNSLWADRSSPRRRTTVIHAGGQQFSKWADRTSPLDGPQTRSCRPVQTASGHRCLPLGTFRPGAGAGVVQGSELREHACNSLALSTYSRPLPEPPPPCRDGSGRSTPPAIAPGWRRAARSTTPESPDRTTSSLRRKGRTAPWAIELLTTDDEDRRASPGSRGIACRIAAAIRYCSTSVRP
jgi:hypothetical protein